MSIDASPTTSPLEALTHAAATDVGMRREENQDSFGILEGSQWKFYIVADGMGGVRGGAIASKLAIEVFEEILADSGTIDQEIISTAIVEANKRVHQKGSDDGTLAGMGTTFVGLGFIDTSLFIFNVGDSRVYRLRQGNFEQLTLDHTLVRELIATGAITEAQAENHPVSHMLTKSLGPSGDIVPDCMECQDGPARGDRYLICSDGLYNMVSDSEIQEILDNSSLEEAQQQLIDLSNERGGSDNITVVLVEVGETFPVGVESLPCAQTESESDSVDDSDGVAAHDDTLELSDQELEARRQLNGIEHDKDYLAQLEEEEGSPELHGGVSIEGIDRDELQEKVKADRESERNLRRFTPLMLFLILLGSGSVIIGSLIIAPFVQMSESPVDSTESSSSERYALEQQGANLGQPQSSLTSSTDKQVSSTEQLEKSDHVGEIKSSGTPVIEGAGSEAGPDGSLIAPEELQVVPSFTAPAYDELVRRRDRLASRVQELERQLNSFDQPISSEVGSILQEARSTRSQLEEALRETRSEIDVATRRLAVWFGRRKRLQSTDPVNLAGEVSVASEVVREQKSSFERATWEYLQEAESLRYNPTDMTLRQRVAELTEVRKQRMNELGDGVREAIKEEIANADYEITELSLRRDRIEADMRELQNQLEYVRILMHGDDEAKAELQRQLTAELEVSKSELGELEDLLATMAPVED